LTKISKYAIITKIVAKKKKKRKKEFWEICKSIRKVWLINPKTRIKKSGKIYNRQKAKQEFRKMLKEEV